MQESTGCDLRESYLCLITTRISTSDIFFIAANAQIRTSLTKSDSVTE